MSDVPDLERALAFYVPTFGLTIRRRFGGQGAELAGWGAPLFLLQKDAGTTGAGNDLRTYQRHWNPVQFGVVVDDIGAALSRAIAAGAELEQGVRVASWGKIARLADPFGHSISLIQFLNRGYDKIADGT